MWQNEIFAFFAQAVLIAEKNFGKLMIIYFFFNPIFSMFCSNKFTLTIMCVAVFFVLLIFLNFFSGLSWKHACIFDKRIKKNTEFNLIAIFYLLHARLRIFESVVWQNKMYLKKKTFIFLHICFKLHFCLHRSYLTCKEWLIYLMYTFSSRKKTCVLLLLFIKRKIVVLYFNNILNFFSDRPNCGNVVF